MSSFTLGVVIAVMSGFFLARRIATRDSLARPSTVLVVWSITIAATAIGARAWSHFLEGVRVEIGRGADVVTHGQGISIVGGWIAGSIAATVVVRLIDADGRHVLGALAPAALLTVGIGRLACLSVGCCFGVPVAGLPSITYERFDTIARPIGVPLAPTQLAASLALVVGSICVGRMSARERTIDRAAAASILFGLERLLEDPFRGDFRGRMLGWPSSSVGAALIVAVCAAVCLHRFIRMRGEA